MEINKTLANALLPNSSNRKNTAIATKATESLLLNHTTEKTLGLTLDANETFENIIKASGLRVNEETLRMLQSLMDNKLPLNEATLQNLNKALKLFNMIENTQPQDTNSLNNNSNLNTQLNNNQTAINTTDSRPAFNAATNIDKAVFLLHNEIPVTNSNANTLQNLVSGGGHIANQIASLAQNISTIDDPIIKNNIIDALLKGVSPESINVNNSANINTPYTNNDLNLQNIAHPPSNVTADNAFKIEQNLLQNTLTIETLTNILEPATPLTRNDITELSELLFKNNPVLKETFLNQLNSLNTDFLDPNFPESNNLKLNTLDTGQMQDTNRDTLIKTLLNQFSIDYNSANPKDIDKILNQLNQNLNAAENLLLNSSYTNVLDNISNIKENLEFLSLIKDSVYIPLPISLGNTTAHGELFIFKDSKRNKKSKNFASALVALDTVYLGRIETYIQKNNNNINLQFRIENTETEPVIKSNINTLHNLLKEYDYTIQSFSVISIDTPFNVLSKEPLVEESTSPSPDLNFSFDAQA